MKLRVLEENEYGVLKSFGDRFFPPEQSVVVIAEDDREIVGRVMLLAPAHMEGPYIIPKFRGSGLLFRLERRIVNEAKNLGASRILAYAANEQIESYLARLGYERLPMTVWIKEI